MVYHAGGLFLYGKKMLCSQQCGSFKAVGALRFAFRGRTFGRAKRSGHRAEIRTQSHRTARSRPDWDQQKCKREAAKRRNGDRRKIVRPHVGFATLGHPRARVVDSARLRAAILALMCRVPTTRRGPRERVPRSPSRTHRSNGRGSSFAIAMSWRIFVLGFSRTPAGMARWLTTRRRPMSRRQSLLTTHYGTVNRRHRSQMFRLCSRVVTMVKRASRSPSLTVGTALLRWDFDVQTVAARQQRAGFQAARAWPVAARAPFTQSSAPRIARRLRQWSGEGGEPPGLLDTQFL